MGPNPIRLMSFHCKERKLPREDRHRIDGHMATEAEIGAMQLQVMKLKDTCSLEEKL